MVVYSCRIEPGHRAKWYSLASVSELNKIKVVAILCVLRYLAEVFFADRARFLGFGYCWVVFVIRAESLGSLCSHPQRHHISAIRGGGGYVLTSLDPHARSPASIGTAESRPLCVIFCGPRLCAILFISSPSAAISRIA